MRVRATPPFSRFTHLTEHRSAGIDASHNPEFTICEFYAPFATLEWLIETSEVLFRHLQEVLRPALDPGSPGTVPFPSNPSTAASNLLAPAYLFQPLKHDLSSSHYERIKFVPSLDESLKSFNVDLSLPDLSSSDATDQLLVLFSTLQLTPPTSPTLPSLLDSLCSTFLEPRCQSPTWITEHPACMSPLAKSFICPETGQLVSARAELFVGGQEYVNTYEEENSPFEQRRKFEEQLKYREAEDLSEVDELSRGAGVGSATDRRLGLWCRQAGHVVLRRHQDRRCSAIWKSETRGQSGTGLQAAKGRKG